MKKLVACEKPKLLEISKIIEEREGARDSVAHKRGLKMHEMHVLVEKPSGRWQTRCRFLFQLGADKLKYIEGMTKKTFLPDPIKMVLCYANRHAETEDWGYVIKNT